MSALHDSKWRTWLKACLQGERVYPCARVTLASGFRLALVYKQISLVGLPYHPGQLYQLYLRVSSCVSSFVTSNVLQLFGLITLPLVINYAFWGELKSLRGQSVVEDSAGLQLVEKLAMPLQPINYLCFLLVWVITHTVFVITNPHTVKQIKLQELRLGDIHSLSLNFSVYIWMIVSVCTNTCHHIFFVC